MSSDHVVSRVHDLLEEQGDMTAEEITKRLAEQGVLDRTYVAQLLTYFVETNGWEESYVAELRARYLDG